MDCGFFQRKVSTTSMWGIIVKAFTVSNQNILSMCKYLQSPQVNIYSWYIFIKILILIL